MFLLPGNVPHSPIRYADTVGIVVEQNRSPDSKGMFMWISSLTLDRLRWYCDNCGEIVHEAAFHLTDLGTQIKEAVENFAASEELRTCKKCGTIAKTKLYDSWIWIYHGIKSRKEQSLHTYKLPIRRKISKADRKYHCDVKRLPYSLVAWHYLANWRLLHSSSFLTCFFGNKVTLLVISCALRLCVSVRFWSTNFERSAWTYENDRKRFT